MHSNKKRVYICIRLKSLMLTTISVLSTIQSSQAIEVQTVPLANSRAVVVTVDVNKDHLQLFLKDSQGTLYQSFNAINQHLLAPQPIVQSYRTPQALHSSPKQRLQQRKQQPTNYQTQYQKQQLIFAMNAGMFHPDYLPVGLYTEQGRELYPLNTATGNGNFFMPPNGVFLLKTTGKRPASYTVQVISTADFQHNTPQQIQLATQSGPLLVYQGHINSQFNPASTSRFIRNAVGIKSSGKAVFVISEQPINFYELANFFKHTLKIDNALYLDGTISSLYLPALKRHDHQRLLGPMIGVTQQVK